MFSWVLKRRGGCKQQATSKTTQSNNDTSQSLDFKTPDLAACQEQLINLTQGDNFILIFSTWTF